MQTGLIILIVALVVVTVAGPAIGYYFARARFEARERERSASDQRINELESELRRLRTPSPTVHSSVASEISRIRSELARKDHELEVLRRSARPIGHWDTAAPVGNAESAEYLSDSSLPQEAQTPVTPAPVVSGPPYPNGQNASPPPADTPRVNEPGTTQLGMTAGTTPLGASSLGASSLGASSLSTSSPSTSSPSTSSPSTSSPSTSSSGTSSPGTSSPGTSSSGTSARRFDLEPPLFENGPSRGPGPPLSRPPNQPPRPTAPSAKPLTAAVKRTNRLPALPTISVSIPTAPAVTGDSTAAPVPERTAGQNAQRSDENSPPSKKDSGVPTKAAPDPTTKKPTFASVSSIIDASEAAEVAWLPDVTAGRRLKLRQLGYDDPVKLAGLKGTEIRRLARAVDVTEDEIREIWMPLARKLSASG